MRMNEDGDSGSGLIRLPLEHDFSSRDLSTHDKVLALIACGEAETADDAIAQLVDMGEVDEYDAANDSPYVGRHRRP